MTRQRATQEEVAHREEQVADLLLSGHSSAKLVAMAIQTWGVSERTAWRYVKNAKDYLESPYAATAQGQRNFLQRKVQRLYLKAMQTEDSALALKALKLEADLINTMEKNSVPNLSEEAFGSEELRAYLQKPRQKR